MTTHTRGPWLYRAKSSAVYTAPEAGSPYQYGAHIFSFFEAHEPSDSDLNLILAAPDLLAACQMFMYSVYQPSVRGEPGSLLETMRSAIAKAMGD